MQFFSFNYSSSERREEKPVKFIAGHRKKICFREIAETRN